MPYLYKAVIIAGGGKRLSQFVKDTPRIQEGHILIRHIIYEIVEKSVFGG